MSPVNCGGTQDTKLLPGWVLCVAKRGTTTSGETVGVLLRLCFGTPALRPVQLEDQHVLARLCLATVYIPLQERFQFPIYYRCHRSV